MNTRMKVAVLSIVPSPYQRDLFEALSKEEEVDLSVFYCEAGSPDSPWAQKELRSFEEVLSGFYMSWGGSRFLINKKLPDLCGFDLLIVNGYMTLAAQRLMRKWTGKIPVLFWGERMVAGSTGIKGFIQRYLASPLKKLDGIVAIGTRAQKDYQERYPKLKIANIPYYCDLSAFEEMRPDERPRKPVTILFCGQMIARKGVDILFNAFSKIVDSGIPARLLLVGREAEMNELLSDCSDAVKNSIEYAGFQQPDTLPHFFKQADIFVLPSRYDGWGVVVNQALGAGLPIVCSDQVGAAYDLIEQGKNGFVFKVNDEEELKASLLKLIEDESFLKKAGEYSLELAKDMSPVKGAEAWLKLIKTYV